MKMTLVVNAVSSRIICPAKGQVYSCECDTYSTLTTCYVSTCYVCAKLLK